MPRTGLSADELKEKAVDAALARMRLVGFDKVRLIDVAKEIRVSHAALYSHFADKAALLDAVIERWLSRVECAMSAVASSDIDPERRIEEWFVGLYQMKRQAALDDPEPLHAFDIASAREKPFVVAHLRTLLEQLASLLAGAKIAREGSDACLKAEMLYEATAAFHHPTLIAQTARDNRETRLREIVALVLDGMKALPVAGRDAGRRE